MLIDNNNLLYNDNMDKPMADSEAATVRINKTNNCPDTSSKYLEKVIKFKFTDNNINSIDIIKIRIFLRLKIKPSTPTKNSKIFIIKLKTG
jgi:hypothetical protein